MNAHTTTNETRFKTLCNSPVLYMRIVILCIFSNCTNCMHLFVSDNTQIIYTVNGQMSGYAKKAIFSCHKQKKLTSQYTCTYSMQNKTTLYPMYVCIGTRTHTSGKCITATPYGAEIGSQVNNKKHFQQPQTVA